MRVSNFPLGAPLLVDGAVAIAVQLSAIQLISELRGRAAA
jgi:hypothetical protein